MLVIKGCDAIRAGEGVAGAERRAVARELREARALRAHRRRWLWRTAAFVAGLVVGVIL